MKLLPLALFLKLPRPLAARANIGDATRERASTSWHIGYSDMYNDNRNSHSNSNLHKHYNEYKQYH